MSFVCTITLHAEWKHSEVDLVINLGGDTLSASHRMYVGNTLLSLLMFVCFNNFSTFQCYASPCPSSTMYLSAGVTQLLSRLSLFYVHLMVEGDGPIK